MHKVFISHHHDRDQERKNYLVELGRKHSLFADRSVDTGDIPDSLSDEEIRIRIRDGYLGDSTVTIVLVGRETSNRKHVDWEIHSSMYNGRRNRKSGIIVINLPGTSDYFIAPHGVDEVRLIHPGVHSWTPIEDRGELERCFPHMPPRIIDNLLAPKVRISVVPWKRIDERTLPFLIERAYECRSQCDYDLSRRMRRRNS